MERGYGSKAGKRNVFSSRVFFSFPPDTCRATIKGMKTTAIVRGKVISFDLSPGMAAAHRRNKGKCMGEVEAIEYVESKHSQHVRKRMSAYVKNRH